MHDDTDEALYQRLADRMPDIIFYCRLKPDLVIEYVSPSVEAVLGYQPEDFYNDTGLLMRAIQSNLPWQLDAARIIEAYEAGTSSHPLRWQHADGSLRWLEDYTIPIFDEMGELVALHGIARDVTQRKLLESLLVQANRALHTHTACSRALTQSDSEAALLDGICQAIIRAGEYDMACIYYPIEDQPALVRPMVRTWREAGAIETYNPGPDASFACPEFEDIVRGGHPVLIDDFSYIAADEDFYDLIQRIGLTGCCALPLIRDSVIFGCLTVGTTTMEAFADTELELLAELASDLAFGIADQRLREAHESSQKKMLEAELMRRRIDQEREVTNLKTRFISIASHEFRTPLTTILTSADIMKVYDARMNGEMRASHLDRIQTAVASMNRLLDDVLTVDQIQSGKVSVNPVPIPLQAHCAALADEMRAQLVPGQVLDYRYNGSDIHALLDENLLRQIVTNLIDNSSKYSPEDGQITFSVTSGINWVKLEVADNGMGIPPHDQHRVFDLFHRATNVGAVQGTGLGLYIVNAAVTLHGGKVRFESTPGSGTTFVISLPLYRAEA